MNPSNVLYQQINFKHKFNFKTLKQIKKKTSKHAKTKQFKCINEMKQNNCVYIQNMKNSQNK